MGIVCKRLIELIQDIIRHKSHVVIVHIFIAGLIELVHIRLYSIAETFLELLTEAICPEMPCLHFP